MSLFLFYDKVSSSPAWPRRIFKGRWPWNPGLFVSASQVQEFKAHFTIPGLELKSSWDLSSFIVLIWPQGRSRGYWLYSCERMPIGRSTVRGNKDKKADSVNKDTGRGCVCRAGYCSDISTVEKSGCGRSKSYLPHPGCLFLPTSVSELAVSD